MKVSVAAVSFDEAESARSIEPASESDLLPPLPAPLPIVCCVVSELDSLRYSRG